MISQKLQLKLQQKFSPQQIMLMKLLQIPVTNLEQTIKEEIEKNPMLEESQDESEENSANTEDQTAEFSVNDENGKNEDEKNEDYDITDYLDDDDIPHYKLNTNNSNGNTEDYKELPISMGKSFQEYLNEQFDLEELTDEQRIIGEELIGNLDDAGYLEREISALVNDFAFKYNIETTTAEIESVLKIIQELDPPGVGARNLQECMVLQLKRKEIKTPAIKNAIRVLENCFDSFSKKHYDKICKRLALENHEFKEAIEEIVTLNPKPGNTVLETERGAQYIVPDFFVYNNGKEIEFGLNNQYIPPLKVSRYYSDMLQNISEAKQKTQEQKKTFQFIKERIDSAKWFIDAIRQRNLTLENTMQAIIEYQKEFFENGDISKLRPMRLKEISDITGLDISTVSRVVNQKYAQTHFGVFLLKDFFSKSFTNEEGEDVATDSIKQIMIECIEKEDKQNPLTDEELKDELNKKGFPLARRTIAKYREALKIPVGRLRKEAKD